MTREQLGLDDRQLARAHREAVKQLWELIPWAPPAIVRELQGRYEWGFGLVSESAHNKRRGRKP